MEKSMVVWLAADLIFSSWIAIRAYFNESLSLSGAFMGFFIMFFHFLVGFRFALVLLVFAIGLHEVVEAEERIRCGSDEKLMKKQRWDWIQVLAKSWIGTTLLFFIAILTRMEDICFDPEQSSTVTYLVGGFVGYYVCLNAVTWSWASGNPNEPPKNKTFGGVFLGSISGLLIGTTFGFISFLAGLVASRCSCITELIQFATIMPIAMAAGIVGFFINSTLEATQEWMKFHCCWNSTVLIGKSYSSRFISTSHSAHFTSSIATGVLSSLAFVTLLDALFT